MPALKIRPIYLKINPIIMQSTQIRLRAVSTINKLYRSLSIGVNRRVVLASRPGKAIPSLDNFRLEEVPIPEAKEGEILLKTEFLSLDPYMRGRMDDTPSYAASVEVDQVMTGGTVSKVVASKHPKFKEGDTVVSMNGWQEYAVSDGKGVMKLPSNMPRPSYALGVLGMPAYTAYSGLIDIGQPKPGETVVVASATGAVGSAVGQIAKLKGCRVVGIAGGEKKCSFAVKEYGFDACIDHKSVDFAKQLAASCPNGVDIYFENVGGAVFEAVFPLLNVKARIPLCGLISQYNGVSPNPNFLANMPRQLLVKRIRLQGLIVFDYYQNIEFFKQFNKEMGEWVSTGKIKCLEDVVQGLENAPQAFLGLLQGKNFGKLVIKVA